MKKIYLLFTMMTLFNAQVALAAKTRNCTMELTAAGISRLEPSLYLHLEVMKALLEKMPRTQAHINVVSSKDTNALVDAALDAVGASPSRLPHMEPKSQFNILLADDGNLGPQSLSLLGLFSWKDPSRPQQRVLRLKFILSDLFFGQPLSDIQLMGIALSMSLASSADGLKLEFDLTDTEYEQLRLKLREINRTKPADPIAALESPSLSQIATTFKYGLADFTLVPRFDDSGPSARVEFNTRKVRNVTEHLRSLEGRGN